MRYIRKRVAALAVVAALGIALLDSCVFLPPAVPWVNNKEVPKSSYGKPADTTLIYGQLDMPSLFGPGTSAIFSDFVQLNPKQTPLILSPGMNGAVFYFQPVPVGSVVHLVQIRYQSGRTTYYFKTGIQKGLDVTATAQKPGLQYAGSWLLTSESKEISLGTPADYGFHPAKQGTELEALKAIVGQFAGTEWEALINARIKELGNGKK